MNKNLKKIETRETDNKTYITLENLKTYNTKYNEKVQGIVTETDNKINTAKTEINSRIDSLEAGRVWKPSVDTFASIATTYPEPQDTWCVITKDTNIIWMYDAEQTQWIDLGHSVIHENATQSIDGLMSKEDKKKLDDLDTTISDATKPNSDKIAEIEANYQAADTLINETISSMDSSYKAADTKLTEDLATAKTELENKIADVDAKFISATEEQIDALFA